MAKDLKVNVYVDGVLYGPAGKKPSAEVAERITNPKAWDSSKDSDDGSKSDAPKYPEGKPEEGWTGKQLDAYAEDHKVDLTGAGTKAEKVAAIEKAAETA